MAVYVPMKDLPGVCERLKERLPESISVFQSIKLILRGLSGYEVYVDSVPDFRALLVKPDKAAMQDPEHEKSTYLFCSDKICLQSLIAGSGLLRQPKICLAGLLKDTYEKAHEIICQSAEQSFLKITAAVADIYSCRSIATLPELPEGYNARSLRPEDADTILSYLWYKDLDYVKSVKRVLQLKSLSVGVESSTGQLVAWTLQHVSGALGMTHVVPEHRNKKLGKYVTAALAQKMITQDGFCWAGIEDGNSISLTLHESVGFSKTEEQLFMGIYYEQTYASNLPQMNMPAPTYKHTK